MKKSLQIALLIIVSAFLYQSVSACGAPQTIYGQASDRIGGVPHARIDVELVGGGLHYSALTNSFGYYSIPNVTPCNEYEISINAKRVTFLNPVRFLYVAGDAEGYEENFSTDESNLVNICVPVTVTGRIGDSFGNGISTIVRVIALQGIDPVTTRTVKSNQFGNYSVPNLISCEQYEFRPVSNRFTFSPEFINAVPSEQSTDINFLGIE